MRVLILSSGGKDSCYAVWWALLQGWEVVGIVTVRIIGEDSMMFQLPSTALAGLQAASAGIPWLPVVIDGESEVEVDNLQDALRTHVDGEGGEESWSEVEWSTFWPENWPRPVGLTRLNSLEPIDGLVSGALRSDYQKTRFERMAERLGVHSFSPLWHNSAHGHMSELVEHDFELMLSSVSADGLTEEWVGRILDATGLDDLSKVSKRYGFSVDGEGGEFETAVLSTPWMASRITVQGAVQWHGQRGQFDIEFATIVD